MLLRQPFSRIETEAARGEGEQRDENTKPDARHKPIFCLRRRESLAGATEARLVIRTETVVVTPTRPRRTRPRLFRPTPAYCPIICLALSGVIAVVATVTVVGTLSAQSSRIDFAMSIAWDAPVG